MVLTKNEKQNKTKNDRVALRANWRPRQWASDSASFPSFLSACKSHTGARAQRTACSTSAHACACPPRHACANEPSKNANKMALRHSCAGLIEQSETTDCVSATGACMEQASRLECLETDSHCALTIDRWQKEGLDIFVFYITFVLFSFGLIFSTTFSEEKLRRPRCSLTKNFISSSDFAFPWAI